MNEQFACKVCSNTPDARGVLSHGKGCYVLDSDGGGDEYIEEADLWAMIGTFAATLKRMLDDDEITPEMRVEVWQRLQAGYCPSCGSGSPCDCSKMTKTFVSRPPPGVAQ